VLGAVLTPNQALHRTAVKERGSVCRVAVSAAGELGRSASTGRAAEWLPRAEFARIITAVVR
jgi:hypothetical protein